MSESTRHEELTKLVAQRHAQMVDAEGELARAEDAFGKSDLEADWQQVLKCREQFEKQQLRHGWAEDRLDALKGCE